MLLKLSPIVQIRKLCATKLVISKSKVLSNSKKITSGCSLFTLEVRDGLKSYGKGSFF